MSHITIAIVISAISCSKVLHGAYHPPAVVASSSYQAVDPDISETRAIGTVIEVDLKANRIVIKTDSGNTVTAFLDEKTDCLRAQPGDVSLGKAVKITRNEIGLGDKVYARGKVSADRKSLPAQKMIVMFKTDIEKDRERQSNEWKLRGIGGVVTSLNPQTGEITVQSRGREGLKVYVVIVTEAVRFRRYAPDSVKFSAARPSAFAELKIGDQLSALGEKSADGVRFKAEQIVFGSFRTVTGTVTAVDAGTGEIRISTLDKKRPLTVTAGKDSTLRRITPQAVKVIAAAAQNARPDNRNAGSVGGADLQETIERLPSAALSEIEPGKTIAVTGPVGADPSRLTAITLIVGIDAVLSVIQSSEASRRSPNLDFGLPAGVFDSIVARP
jgi:hypothetical protein